MGKISIVQGIYISSWEKAYDRYEFYHNMKIQLVYMPVKFQNLLFEKAVKFNDRYNIRDIPFTIGNDVDNRIMAIAICYPYFDDFRPDTGENIVIGRIRRMRGDLKYEIYKPKRDKHGKIILDENDEPIMKFRTKHYIPYDLDEKVLDKDGNETDKLKYPYIFKYEDFDLWVKCWLIIDDVNLSNEEKIKQIKKISKKVKIFNMNEKKETVNHPKHYNMGM